MGKSNINIKFKSSGGVRQVTGSSHILEIKVNNVTTNIMLDLGAVQNCRLNVKESFEVNKVNTDMSNINHIILSHAHLDHSMNLCQLSRLDFNGTVYMSDITLQLVKHITSDGINIHLKTTEYLNKIKSKKEPEIFPYMNLRSRSLFLDKVKICDFEKWIKINDNIRFKLLPSGHISGAASVYIEVKYGKDVETVYFSGDNSANRDIPFTKKANIENLKISTAILESTYGGQKIPQKSESDMIKDLSKLINKTCIKNKGVLLIPAFAMARSTNVAYYIKKTYEKYPKFKNIPIYMVSPLMKRCHNVISKNSLDYDKKWQDEMDLFAWKNIKFITDYKFVLSLGNSTEPCIIISSSGMGKNGVNSYLLPKKAESKKNTIVFTGYCAKNTEGYQLTNGLISQMKYNINGEITTIDVKANIENISGLSSHACGYEIIDMLKTADTSKLKNIIITHGDLERGEMFKEDLLKEFNNVNIYIPKKDQVVKL